MSLTALLDKKDVKDKFREEFYKPRFSVKKELLAPPLTNNYGLVGTAFDYLFRFYLKYLNPKAITGQWIAEMSLKLIRDKLLFREASSIISKAKENYLTFLKTGQMNDDLIKSALLLAQLDPIFRAGIVNENIGTTDDRDVEDLRNLISLVDPEKFKAKDVCLLNPVFKASELVGGADIDLVIDDMMIDVKTTKNLELRREHFNQLIGYYALYRIGGIGAMPRNHEIKRVGIYFSRYGYLHLIKIQDVIDENSFPRFLEWFVERATSEVHPKKWTIS